MSGNEQHASLGTSLLYANQNKIGPPPDIFGAKIIVVQWVTEVDALVRGENGGYGSFVQERTGKIGGSISCLYTWGFTS